jgi:ABC-type glycerol-3-phosphate transport system permease component
MTRPREWRAVQTVALYGALSLLAVWFLLPFLWMALTAFKAPGEVFTRVLPSAPRWANFREVFTQPTLPFGRFFLNSAFLTLAGTALSLFSSSLAAFGFARLRFAGRDALFIAVLATMMVPGVVTMIPTFVLFQRLGWVDTFLPFLVPALGGSAFQIFFLRESFKTLPDELFEAAQVDGCSNLRAWLTLGLPLVKPTLATLAIFSFLGYWNDFMGPLIYLHSTENRTLALGLYAFSSVYGTQWHLLMAASLVAILPILVVFFRCQRYFERGLVMTGVKG